MNLLQWQDELFRVQRKLRAELRVDRMAQATRIEGNYHADYIARGAERIRRLAEADDHLTCAIGALT